MTVLYELKLTRDGDTILVGVPAFPEIDSFGSSEVNALHWGALAIEEAIAARMADGEPIPAPLATAPAEGHSVEISSES